jgi:hypothetical protein
MKRKVAGAVLTLLVAAFGAGCGGNDDDKGKSATKTTATVAATTPLSKAEYIKRANAICRQTRAKLTAEGAKFRTTATKTATLPPPEKIREFVTKVSIPGYERMLVALRALTPPQRDKRTIVAFVVSLSNAIDTVKADIPKYAQADAVDPFDDANARAVSYGMKDCGG